MRRIVSVIATVVTVVAAVVVAVTVARSSHGADHHQAARRGVVPALPGSVDIVRYQKFGGSQRCGSDFCNVGVPGKKPHFTLPANPNGYRSTLTVSFRYRAFGKDAKFAVRTFVAGQPAQVRPIGERLLSTNGRLSTVTVVVIPGLLSGGVEHHLRLEPEITHKLVNAGITVTHVVWSLHAWSA